VSAERLAETVLHEVVHMAVGAKRRDGRRRAQWHGRAFKRRLWTEAVKEWPELPGLVDAEPLIRDRSAYDLDEAIVEALHVARELTHEG
jgi:hypothetical protein